MKMEWFNNFTISKKLLSGFGIVIILTIILAISSIFIINEVDNRYTELEHGAQKELSLSKDVGRAFSMSRRCLLIIAYNADDLIRTKSEYEVFKTEITNSVNGLKSIQDIIRSDTRIDQEEKNKVLSQVQEILDMVDIDYRTAGENVMKAIESGDTVEVKNIISGITVLANKATTLLDDYIKLAESVAIQTSIDVSAEADKYIMILFIIAVFTVLISIALAYMIARMINRPILSLSKAAKEISNGNLNVNVSSNARDEVGRLSNDIDRIVQTFGMLISEINNTAAQMRLGEIDARIDENKFIGDYRDVASAINQSYTELITETLDFLHYIKEFAQGNFDIAVKRLPGKKAVMHENMDLLQKNLKDISSEIGSLIKSASQGDFSIQIHEDLYSGNWKDIANGLNDLINAVRTPIAEVAHVLEEVAKANFDISIEGEYKGQFQDMKDAVNKTITNTSVYIKDISEILNRMSKQDLDITVTKDYIGDFRGIKDALEQILETFNRLINDFSASAEQVAAGAKQISESSMTLAQGATEQASAVEELNSTVTSISQKTTDNAINARKANELAATTREDGMVGKEEMEKMLQSMADIEEASLNISKIIKTIEDIAFQTNLLALNAAVEAARAGAHGKGFAVVADEVRGLAARSQNATVDTTELINKTVNIISNGTKIANSTASSLNEMVNKITGIAQLIDQVSTASSEQEIAISQINQGIVQISEVTQSNTATSEESASSAQQLSSQAEVFRNAINEFNLRRY